MKLKTVVFNSEEEPQRAEFSLSVDEAALIYAFVGHVSPQAVEMASGDAKWGQVLSEVASCFAGSFFNRFWENGASDVAPRLTPRVSGGPK